MATHYTANWKIRTQDQTGTKLRFGPGDKVQKVDPHLLEDLVKSGAVTKTEEVEAKKEKEPDPKKDE